MKQCQKCLSWYGSNIHTCTLLSMSKMVRPTRERLIGLIADYKVMSKSSERRSGAFIEKLKSTIEQQADKYEGMTGICIWRDEGEDDDTQT